MSKKTRRYFFFKCFPGIDTKLLRITPTRDSPSKPILTLQSEVIHSMQRCRLAVLDRPNKRERDISDQHMGEFRPEGSRGLAFLNERYQGSSLTRKSLIHLAMMFSVIGNLQFPRDFKRRRNLIVKWFDDNIDILEPLGTIISTEVEALQPTVSGRHRMEREPSADDC